ncbi:MAG: hypothetical protein VX589_17415 [Myxococcota bacterium]|nr:hypothetical protein [Myxococcota bacterium]
MKWIWTAIVLFGASPVFGQATPIRGTTGGGYGQFSWGTSLETVERFTPRLSLNNETASAQEARQLLKRLKKNRKKKGGKSEVTSYRSWIKLGALPARVDLEFFRDQLSAAVVTMTYTPQREDIIRQALDVLANKYGSPKLDNAERADPSVDETFRYDRPTGPVHVQHLRPVDKQRGILTIKYSSAEFAPRIEAYLQQLRMRVGRLTPPKRATPQDTGRQAPTKLQRQLDTHL